MSNMSNTCVRWSRPNLRGANLLQYKGKQIIEFLAKHWTNGIPNTNHVWIRANDTFADPMKLSFTTDCSAGAIDRHTRRWKKKKNSHKWMALIHDGNEMHTRPKPLVQLLWMRDGVKLTENGKKNVLDHLKWFRCSTRSCRCGNFKLLSILFAL